MKDIYEDFAFEIADLYDDFSVARQRRVAEMLKNVVDLALLVRKLEEEK